VLFTASGLTMASAGTLDTSKCEYCYLSNHAIDHCWKLHGKPPRQANITQVDRSHIIQTKPSPQGLPASYEDFLKWCQNNPNSGSTASIAHTGNSSVCLSQSSLGPWVIDSGASDHVTGNKSLFSSLSTSGFLPSITSANGSQTQSQGIGTVQILPSLSVDSVLYIPGCPFNLLSVNRLTRSLDCIVTFTNSNVTLQDRS
jgi:hypothetical protein